MCVSIIALVDEKILLLLLFHMYYIYTRCPLADFHTPTVSLGTYVRSSRERHYSCLTSSSSYGLPDRSIFLASSTWDPLILYQYNVADADSG